MKYLSSGLAIILFFCGCQSLGWYPLTPEQRTVSFEVKHALDPGQAFIKTELALAESYNDLPRVLKLRQPESGTFIIKALQPFQVGGRLGALLHSDYSLKISVEQTVIRMTFYIGTAENGSWPPQSELEKIRNDFEAVARRIAASVGGTLQGQFRAADGQ